jgi:hypothetical protein
MSTKYSIGDIVYNKFTDGHYLIQGFVDIGGTPCYDFLILSPSSYRTVEVAVSTVDSINHSDYSLVA